MKLKDGAKNNYVISAALTFSRGTVGQHLWIQRHRGNDNHTFEMCVVVRQNQYSRSFFLDELGSAGPNTKTILYWHVQKSFLLLWWQHQCRKAHRDFRELYTAFKMTFFQQDNVQSHSACVKKACQMCTCIHSMHICEWTAGLVSLQSCF